MRYALAVLSFAFSIFVSAAAPAAAQSAPQTAATAEAKTSDSAYRLGPGDKVRVTTFGEASLTGEFSVDGSGLVSLPLVGSIKAGGLTAQELQGAFEQALASGYLKDPKVNVEVLTYRPFYILGEVNRPGTYPYTDGLTVMNAVATAQGFTYRANTKKVFLKHANENLERSVPLNGATMVAPGDTIRIGERFF